MILGRVLLSYNCNISVTRRGHCLLSIVSLVFKGVFLYRWCSKEGGYSLVVIVILVFKKVPGRVIKLVCSSYNCITGCSRYNFIVGFDNSTGVPVKILVWLVFQEVYV